jgi:ABC-2 type transport system permease protein
MIRKEFIQALRDPRMRAMLVMPPLIQLMIFGYAASLDVDNAKIAWMDQDRTPESRDLLAEFEGSGRFILTGFPDNERAMQSMMDRGQVDAVIRVLPGFGRDVERGRSTGVQVLLDGTNSNTAGIISGFASQCIGRYSNEVLQKQQRSKMISATETSGGAVTMSVAQVASRTRVWFNPDLRSRNYFIPGVIVNIITLVTLSLTAMAIVREKEIGTMEQLMVTPLRPIELMLGKTLPFALVGLVDVVVITAAALIIFHIPLRGNPLLLLGCAVLYLLTSLGAGLFLSTVSQTQQQAMMASFFFTTPAFMLSGFAFPVRNMPVFVQYLTYLNPIRYFMEIVRGIFLKGVGFSALWPQMLALMVYGVTVLSLSVARFHKSLD